MDVSPGILYRGHIKKFEHFHVRALRCILGIKRQDKVSNLKVLEPIDCTSIGGILIKAQMRWVEHIIRIDEYRMPRRLSCVELVHRVQNQGRPKRQYKHTVKANLQWCNTKPIELEQRAGDRTSWRAIAHSASNNFEEDPCQRLILAKEKSFSHTIPDQRLQVPPLFKTVCFVSGASQPPANT